MSEPSTEAGMNDHLREEGDSSDLELKTLTPRPAFETPRDGAVEVGVELDANVEEVWKVPPSMVVDILRPRDSQKTM